MQNMKLAVSGGSYTGKSILVNHLRDSLLVPLIGEHRLFLNRIYRDRDNISKVIKGSARWVAAKSEEEAHLLKSGFVSDRCSIDIFAICSDLPKFKANKDARKIHDFCRERCAHYDYVIIPPWGVVGFREVWDEKVEPLKRIDSRSKPIQNPWFNLKMHTAIVGLAYTWLPPEKVLLIPREIVDIHERVAWVREKIGA